MTATTFTLENKDGLSVSVMNYGATISALRIPDRDGDFADVVLGFDSLDDYRRHDWYCGAAIGRYAGRIRDAAFELDGHRYEVAANQGTHQLHGGLKGFDKVFWDARALPHEPTVCLR